MSPGPPPLPLRCAGPSVAVACSPPLVLRGPRQHSAILALLALCQEQVRLPALLPRHRRFRKTWAITAKTSPRPPQRAQLSQRRERSRAAPQHLGLSLTHMFPRERKGREANAADGADTQGI